MVGELLSGSAPPAEFFSPFGLLVLTILYGGGAILVRELIHRWRKGWVSLFLLGAAYGIVEEGLMVKSFFDPNWMDIGILGSYGRWAGVNWVWSLELTVYHAVFSIAIPILLVTLLFPSRRSEPWVSGKAFWLLFSLFVADVAFGFLALTPYRPPVVPYLLAVAAVIGLILLARRLPDPMFAPRDTRVPRPRRFAVTGFLATLGFFLVNWVLPGTGIPALLTVGLALALVGGTLRVVLRMSGNGAAWTERHQLALASGALGFFILLAPLQELDKTRPDNTAGMALVGLVALVFLAWMARRIRRAEEAEATADG